MRYWAISLTCCVTKSSTSKSVLLLSVRTSASCEVRRPDPTMWSFTCVFSFCFRFIDICYLSWHHQLTSGCVWPVVRLRRHSKFFIYHGTECSTSPWVTCMSLLLCAIFARKQTTPMHTVLRPADKSYNGYH